MGSISGWFEVRVVRPWDVIYLENDDCDRLISPPRGFYSSRERERERKRKTGKNVCEIEYITKKNFANDKYTNAGLVLSILQPIGGFVGFSCYLQACRLHCFIGNQPDLNGRVAIHGIGECPSRELWEQNFFNYRPPRRDRNRVQLKPVETTFGVDFRLPKVQIATGVRNRFEHHRRDV